MFPILTTQMGTYQEFVEAHCPCRPSLLPLYHFFSDPAPQRFPCRIVALQFFSGTRHPYVSDIEPRHMQSRLLSHSQAEDRYLNTYNGDLEKLLGEILIVEDLTKDVVEILGSSLDIDPTFFAKHLIDSRHAFFDPSTPPSRSASKVYLNVSYHRVVSFEGQEVPIDSPLNVTRKSNVSRKMVVLPPMGKFKIGLVQHCCSMLILNRSDGTWLGEWLTSHEADIRYVVHNKQALSYVIRHSKECIRASVGIQS